MERAVLGVAVYLVTAIIVGRVYVAWARASVENRERSTEADPLEVGVVALLWPFSVVFWIGAGIVVGLGYLCGARKRAGR